MSNKSNLRLVFKVGKETYKLLSVTERKCDDLIVAPNKSEFYRDFNKEVIIEENLKIKNQKYSVHCSPNSKTGINAIVHRLEYGNKKINTNLYTKALKKNNLFIPLYSARSPNLLNKEYKTDLKRNKIINLGTYDPNISVLYYQIIISNTERDFNISSEIDFNFKSIKFRKFTLTIIWSFGILPSDGTGAKIHFTTLPDETIKNQCNEGFTSEQITHTYREYRQLLHNEFINLIIKRDPSLSKDPMLINNYGFKKKSERGLSKEFKTKLELEKAYKLKILGDKQNSLGKTEVAINYYSSSELIFKKLKMNYAYASIINAKSIVYQKSGKPSISLKLYKKTLNIYKNLNDKYNESNALLNIGMSIRDQGNHLESISYYKESLTISKKMKYDTLLANGNKEIGIAYIYLDNLDKAIEFLNIALELYVSEKNLDNIAFVFGNLGIIKARKGDIKKSYENHNKALNLFKKTNNILGIANETANIGNILRIQKEWEKSEKMLIEALNLHKIIDFQYGIATDYKLIGVLYLNKNNFEKGKYYINLSLDILIKTGNILEIKAMKDLIEKIK